MRYKARRKGGCGCSMFVVLLFLVLIFTVITMSFNNKGSSDFTYEPDITPTTNTTIEHSESTSGQTDNPKDKTSQISDTLSNYILSLKNSDKKMFEDSITLLLKNRYLSEYESIEDVMENKKITYSELCGKDVVCTISNIKTEDFDDTEISMLQYLYNGESGGDNIKLEAIRMTCDIIVFDGNNYTVKQVNVTMVSENGVWKVADL